MNNKTKAEEYVREKLPHLKELGMGCVVEDVSRGLKTVVLNGAVNGDVFVSYGTMASGQYRVPKDRLKIIGHPINLQDWLSVLGHKYSIDGLGRLKKQITFSPTNPEKVVQRLCGITFNLTTGQPATPEDYQKLCEVLNI